MHRLFYIMAYVMTLLACAQEAPKSIVQTTVISGHIDHPKAKCVTLSKQGILITTSSVEDGLFYLETSINKPGYYTLSHGALQIQLYLRREFRLNLSFDPEIGLRSIRYQGRGSEANTYLSNFQEFQRLNEPQWADFWSRGEVLLNEQVHRYQIKSEAFVDNYLSKHANLDPNFIATERSRIEYQSANRYLQFGHEHDFVSEFPEQLSEGYYGFLSGLTMEDPDLLVLPAYQEFLYRTLQKYVVDIRANGNEKSKSVLAMDLVRNEIRDPDIKSFLSYRVICKQLQKGKAEEHDLLYKQFRKTCKVGQLLANAKELYDQCETLSQGSIAPFFSVRDITNTEVSLTEFRESVLYIDLWSSWAYDQNHARSYCDTLRNLFKDESIVFLSISLDQSEQIWKEGLRKNKLRGIQLFSPKGMDSKLAQIYFVRDLPRYILIDKKGRIVEAFAPAPSSLELKQKLKMLLNTA
ncbi:MAG: TlpA family protein disulfide reductase [Saprospiraceae bacterium]|nr:TlpA family protein disulfide reductase [Saprospiraceae bacterium]